MPKRLHQSHFIIGPAPTARIGALWPILHAVDTVRDMPAPYACDPSRSLGRLHAEPESETRTAYQRDRDRIIHCAAFRRLKYKTQVFVFHEGDYYRTRLTHSLEVAQIARSVARHLQVDEDLAEAISLAHDLGHTPFGHAGETVLNDLMAPYGGFSHNDQTVRVLTDLERRYAEFDGLNLTWETLEGVVKHNGPVAEEARSPAFASILALDGRAHLRLDTFASLEAQIAAVSDDIAYNNHDIDDGLRAGFFTVDELADLPVVGPIVRTLDRRYPGLEPRRQTHEIVRQTIGHMVGDLLAETSRRLEALAPDDPEAIRLAGTPMAQPSAQEQEDERRLRDFLFERMYRHYRINRETSKARRLVADLFNLFMAEPNCLPTPWQEVLGTASDDARRARHVADYIAGMTDRYAMLEHRRLFGITDPVRT